MKYLLHRGGFNYPDGAGGEVRGDRPEDGAAVELACPAEVLTALLARGIVSPAAVAPAPIGQPVPIVQPAPIGQPGP